MRKMKISLRIVTLLLLILFVSSCGSTREKLDFEVLKQGICKDAKSVEEIQSKLEKLYLGKTIEFTGRALREETTTLYIYQGNLFGDCLMVTADLEPGSKSYQVWNEQNSTEMTVTGVVDEVIVECKEEKWIESESYLMIEIVFSKLIQIESGSPKEKDTLKEEVEAKTTIETPDIEQKQENSLVDLEAVDKATDYQAEAATLRSVEAFNKLPYRFIPKDSQKSFSEKLTMDVISSMRKATCWLHPSILTLARVGI